MADQIVVTEKSSQAKDVRAAVAVGDILPFVLSECSLSAVPICCAGTPTHSAQADKPRSQPFATLRTAKRLLATDCDREVSSSQKFLEHYSTAQ